MTTQIIKYGLYGKELNTEEVLSIVPQGWKTIVRQLITELFDMGWDGDLFQVKEKFGSLRFYIGDGTDAMHNLITKYEHISCRTCEVCGSPGTKLTKHGWLKVLCTEHSLEAT